MIRHVLRSGQQAKTVEGYLLRKEEYPLVYEILAETERKQNEKAVKEKG